LKDIIQQSLECVVERAGDPVDAVYKRLFEKHPDMEALFILDKTGDARGHMFAEVLECVMDYCDGDKYATNFVASEQVNHEGIGVPPDVFASFLDVVIEVFQEIAGPLWSTETGDAWMKIRNALCATST
jgi:hemoglobin-like flavoprotein